MGKKRVAKQTTEELLQESEGIQKGVERQVTKTESAKRLKQGRIYIFSSYNNTLITLTDAEGNVIKQVSAGAIGFKGTKKSTPYAASRTAETIAQIIDSQGIGRADVYIKGVGPGRDSALRSLGAKSFEISSIKDITPIPHNGPKKPRARRV